MLRNIIASATAIVLGSLVVAPQAVAANAGPDPAVTQITIRDIAPSRQGRFDFQVICVVENLGASAFVSTKRGQGIALYQLAHGESEGHRLRYRRFAELTPGETLRVGGWIRDWPADRTIPSSFECRLEYDVENRADGDPENDDNDLANNRRIIRGINILQLLVRPAQPAPPIAPGG